MADPIRTLVALDNDIDHEMVNSSLPATAAIQLVGVVDGLDESWATLQETPTDLLVVACGAHSERALFLIDGAVKQQPERPVVVLTVESANGFTRRVFEAGADDILTVPEDPSNVRFAFEKAIARRRGGSAGAGDCGRTDAGGAGAEGRHRQDADGVQPGRRAGRARASGSCWSTSTCSSATSACRWA